MTTLTITRPDDWHVHLRDGDVLTNTVKDISRYNGRALIMPNTVPPVTNTEMAIAYRDRIMAEKPSAQFEPLMALYLTDNTTPDEIKKAKASGAVVAAKLYPAGATTNSDSGVTSARNIYPVLEAMQEVGMLLLIHGEVTTHDVDIFDREKAFLDTVLAPIVNDFPGLKIVLEHITTSDAASFVKNANDNVAATITAHHLMYNRNHMLVGGIKPHFYCLPILKRNTHQKALVEAATSGSKSSSWVLTQHRTLKVQKKQPVVVLALIPHTPHLNFTLKCLSKKASWKTLKRLQAKTAQTSMAFHVTVTQ